MKRNPSRAFAALLALLTALCLCTVALASDSGTWGKLKWTIENGVLTISGKGKMEDCSVHGWDNWRMSQSKYSKAVIESGVTTIGANCFRSIDIKSVSIPKTVTRIGGMAFYWDVKLTSVTIPSSVTRIDGSAFGHCSALKSITVPASVKTIGLAALGDCAALKEIKVAKGNKHYTSADGILYKKGKKTLVQYPAGRTDKVFAIPSYATAVEEWAFTGCKNLTRVKFATGTGTIPAYCFYDCVNMKEVTIPASVKTVGNNAFMNCDKLKKVYYAGSEEDRAKMSIGESGNEKLTGAKWYYNHSGPDD